MTNLVDPKPFEPVHDLIDSVTWITVDRPEFNMAQQSLVSGNARCGMVGRAMAKVDNKQAIAA